MFMVISSSSETELPLQSDVLLKLPLQDHFGWAKVHLEKFEVRFHASWIDSVCCCEAYPWTVLDETLDSIHTRTFRSGFWLKERYT